VAEVRLDGSGVGAGGDEQTGARVAQVVNPKSLWEVGLLDCGYQTWSRKLLLRNGAPRAEVNTSASGSSGACRSRSPLGAPPPPASFDPLTWPAILRGENQPTEAIDSRDRAEEVNVFWFLGEECRMRCCREPASAAGVEPDG
jgi:hypothetical protein